ncbi:MAG: DUF1232 domain-containing protein [Clostridia bacterium]|nr:DUF1232 domain-containing protein [Clostridia bacterium]
MEENEKGIEEINETVAEAHSEEQAADNEAGLNGDAVAEQLGIFEKKAEKLLRDEGKFRRFIDKAVRFIRKAESIPMLGDIVDDCATMIELLCDWVGKRYRKAPLSSVISSTAGILYLISPIDLIPDSLPLVGYLDDISVITTIMKLGLAHDLDRYREWKIIEDKKLFRARVDAEIDRFDPEVGKRMLVACFLTDDGKLKLVCTAEDNGEYPLVCRAELLELPEWGRELNKDGITELYNAVISDHSFIRSSLGKLEFMTETEFRHADRSFIIENAD